LTISPKWPPLAIDSDETLARLSDERSLSLNPNDIPTIRSYFLKPEVLRQRRRWACPIPRMWNWSTSPRRAATIATTIPFGGRFHYKDMGSGRQETIDSLFKTLSKARPCP
jgi:hypothetical protein